MKDFNQELKLYKSNNNFRIEKWKQSKYIGFLKDQTVLKREAVN